MNFSQVDPTIHAWARANNLPLSIRYQDSDVRSFELVGPSGRAQLWVEVNEQIKVCVWDFRKRKEFFVTELSGLDAALDRAARLARPWCGNVDGNE